MNSRCALLLHQPEPFRQFHENLCETLRLLNLPFRTVETWTEAREIFGRQDHAETVFIVDPMLEGAEEESIRNTIREGRPKGCCLILIADHPENAAELQERLDADAALTRLSTQREIAFTLNRFLRVEPGTRSTPRALAEIQVEYVDPETGRPRHETTFTLSEGGLFVRTYQPLAPGTAREFVLHLPDGGKPVSCIGAVIYSRAYTLGSTDVVPSGMGIQFKMILPKDRERIARFVGPALPRVDQRRSPQSKAEPPEDDVPAKASPAES